MLRRHGDEETREEGRDGVSTTADKMEFSALPPASGDDVLALKEHGDQVGEACNYKEIRIQKACKVLKIEVNKQ